MTTPNPAATPNKQFWAVHLKGVDQVLAMLNFETANQWAANTNAEWERQPEEHRASIPEFAAVVIQSPWSGEQHYMMCAQALAQTLQAGDALLNNLRAHVAELTAQLTYVHSDAMRYYLHRDITLNPELEKGLEPHMAFMDELEEPKDALEYNSLMDRCIEAAKASGLWPAKAPEAAAEVAA